jgi:pimeloyl-ACP methyl ester carboxylesterase
MNPDADLTPRGVADIIADFIAALDLQDVVLVGNDSGGAVCQIVVTERPERIGRLVLTTCDAFEVFPPKLFVYLKWLAKAPRLVRFSMRVLLASPLLRRLPVTYGYLTKKKIDPALSEEWVRPSAEREDVRRDVAKFIAGTGPHVTMHAAAALPNVDMPALVLWAREDPSFPLSLGKRLAETLPNARLELLDDAWVFAQLDRPEAVASSIARFVDQTKLSTKARASTMLSSIEQ